MFFQSYWVKPIFMVKTIQIEIFHPFCLKPVRILTTSKWRHRGLFSLNGRIKLMLNKVLAIFNGARFRNFPITHRSMRRVLWKDKNKKKMHFFFIWQKWGTGKKEWKGFQSSRLLKGLVNTIRLIIYLHEILNLRFIFFTKFTLCFDES